MMISTKGRYALRVMIDLAEHTNGGSDSGGSWIPMKEIADRQKVSLKYLEKILPSLAKNGLIEGQHGKGGGYRLTRDPDAYRVGEILRLTEGELAPVACLSCQAEPCRHTADCRTRPMWEKLHDLINDYLDSVTVADLMRSPEHGSPIT